MSEDKPKLDSEAAKKVLADENKAKVAACQKELNEVLERHGCLLNAGMFVSSQGNRPIIEIAIKPEAN
jgi:hypothetical protein